MMSLFSHIPQCAPRLGMLVAVALVLGTATPAPAMPGGGKTPRSIVEAQQDAPPQLKGVDVEEHLGDPVPPLTRFLDSNGQEVTLGTVLPKTLPTLLTLVYYNCPMLCNLVLNAQVKTMRELGLELGRDYEAVTISVDPEDTPAMSSERRRKHLQSMGKPESAPWHFLTGTDAEIRRLADAVGFKYTYDESTKQYAHPAVVMVLTPEGTLSRYLYGTDFPPKDMKLALLEAAGGRVGTSFDRVVMSCFKYDTATRRYGFYIFGFIRLGALAVFFALATMLIYFWRRELKKGAAA
ncbi:protein SCO1/2 [Myxococcus fulvus]|uniref:Electron transporter SenC n=1 Tax=Myxococcus fulvus TaxID=33 RepID=A0A511SW18_MYXFU|nr:SCO family protein [Myxococcus fulvus]GEN06100.1 electron transporter SenC [Myxococcus fulvus]SET58561.1 protein SCO1/2 [Myxococcus fulvus]